MLRQLAINDFKVEVAETETLDSMTISIELGNDASPEETIDVLKQQVRQIFEVSAEVEMLSAGTLEQEFQLQVKQQRFIDKRG